MAAARAYGWRTGAKSQEADDARHARAHNSRGHAPFPARGQTRRFCVVLRSRVSVREMSLDSRFVRRRKIESAWATTLYSIYITYSTKLPSLFPSVVPKTTGSPYTVASSRVTHDTYVTRSRVVTALPGSTCGPGIHLRNMRPGHVWPQSASSIWRWSIFLASNATYTPATISVAANTCSLSVFTIPCAAGRPCAPRPASPSGSLHPHA